MAFFPWPREKKEKKKVLIKPVYFNIITSIPQMCSFFFLPKTCSLQRIFISLRWVYAGGVICRWIPGLTGAHWGWQRGWSLGRCIPGEHACREAGPSSQLPGHWHRQRAAISTGRTASRKPLQNFLFVAYFATENSWNQPLVPLIIKRFP